MEANEIQTALVAAAEEVLETMCFATIFASSEGAITSAGAVTSEAAGPPAEPAITAGLSFQGSPSGTFRVGVPPKLARVLAAGFFGREETEVSDEQGAEVVCELANMICGSVLSRLESEETFHISHPELLGEADLQPLGGAGLQPAQADETLCPAPDPNRTFPHSQGLSASHWFDLGDGVLTATLELQQAA